MMSKKRGKPLPPHVPIPLDGMYDSNNLYYYHQSSISNHPSLNLSLLFLLSLLFYSILFFPLSSSIQGCTRMYCSIIGISVP